MGCNVILYLSSKTFVSLGAPVLVIHLIKICYDLISVSLPHIFCYSVVTRLYSYSDWLYFNDVGGVHKGY